jgi:hypothetical protein
VQLAGPGGVHSLQYLEVVLPQYEVEAWPQAAHVE